MRGVLSQRGVVDVDFAKAARDIIGPSLTEDGKKCSVCNFEPPLFSHVDWYFCCLLPRCGGTVARGVEAGVSRPRAEGAPARVRCLYRRGGVRADGMVALRHQSRVVRGNHAEFRQQCQSPERHQVRSVLVYVCRGWGEAAIYRFCYTLLAAPPQTAAEWPISPPTGTVLMFLPAAHPIIVLAGGDASSFTAWKENLTITQPATWTYFSLQPG